MAEYSLRASQCGSNVIIALGLWLGCVVVAVSAAASDALVTMEYHAIASEGESYEVAEVSEDCGPLVMLLQTELATSHATQGGQTRQRLHADSGEIGLKQKLNAQQLWGVTISNASITTTRIVTVSIVVTVVMAASYIIMWFRTPTPSACVKWQLQVLAYCDLFLMGIVITSMAPIALSIAAQLNHGADFSGLLLSSLFLCSAPGAILGRLVATSASQSTKRVLQCLLMLLGSCCCFIDGFVTLHPDILGGKGVSEYIFVASRATFGFAMFMWVSIMMSMVTAACQIQLRVRQQVCQNLSLMAGGGSGAVLVAVFTSSSHSTPAESLGYSGPFFFLAGLYIVHALCAWLVTPGTREMLLEAAEDTCGLELVAGDVWTPRVALPPKLLSDERSLWLRKVIFVLGNLYGVERAAVTISLEAATSYVLEVHFGWTPSKVSIWVGAIYLLGTVLFVPINMLKDKLGELFLMKCASILGVVASALMAIFIYRSEFVVLAADCTLFSACCFAAALAEGMSLAVAIPDDPWFNQESAWAFRNVVKQNVARFVAPMVVRSTLARSATLYGVLQVTMTTGGFLICHGLSNSACELSAISLDAKMISTTNR